MVDVNALREEAAEKVASANWLAGVSTSLYLLVLVPVLALSTMLSVLPPTWKVWHKMHLWSAYQMQKAANADVVAHVRRTNGHEDTLPAAWVEGAEDEKDRSGWAVKGLGDKRFDTAVHNNESSRFGKAQIINLDEDASEQGTWAECTMDNAFQLDRERYLFRNAQVDVQELVYQADPTGNGAAVTDGGQQYRTQNVSLARPGVLEDTIIPLNSREGYGGQQVSWNQYQNLKSEQSDQETIRDAKNSAWTAAKLDDVEGMDILKWALIIGGWSALLLFKDSIAAAIASFGGGGGNAVGSAASQAGLGMIHLAGMGLV